MTHRIVGAVLFLAGLVVVLLPRYILPVCEYYGYPAMACSHTGMAERFIGFIVMAASCGIFLTGTREALRWLALTVLTSGVSIVLLPEAIGYCHSNSMPCNYGTIPALRLIGALIILLSLTGFLVSLRRQEKE